MKDQDIINEDERHEAATETPIGEVKDEGEQRNVPLAHFPSGAEGTEPGGEPDYEMLARELTRDGFDSERLAKAIEALASEKPVDYPTFYTPGWLVDLAKKTQSEQQREEARRKRKIHWRCYDTKVDLAVMGKTQQNGKVYEVRIAKRQADVSDTYAQLKVNGKTVLTGSFIGSAWMANRMMTAAAQALVNRKAKRNRDKRRRAAKRAAAAQAIVEKELA